MIGGTVTQSHIIIQEKLTTRLVEVADKYGTKLWREIDHSDVRTGDFLWWQGFKGYLSRGGDGMSDFCDREIGRCVPACSYDEAMERRTGGDS